VYTAARGLPQKSELGILWTALDSAGLRALRAAEARIVSQEGLALPVNSTPAGNYVGLYWQYGSTHPIPAQYMSCNDNPAIDDVSGSAEGHGHDDVGNFSMKGEFLQARLALTKKYVRGTGNPKENLGHSVALRLTCCDLARALPDKWDELARFGAPPGVVGFFGTWHVRTRNYSGDAQMVLWLPPEPVMIGHVITQSTVQQMTQTTYTGAVEPSADGTTSQTLTTTTSTSTTTTITSKPVFGWMNKLPFYSKPTPASTPSSAPKSEAEIPTAVPTAAATSAIPTAVPLTVPAAVPTATPVNGTLVA